MSSKPKPSTVIFAKDVDALARFYAETIELTEVHRYPGHVILDGGPFLLVIHGIPRGIAKRIEITTPPKVRENVAIKICVPVESIERARAHAASLGGAILAKDQQWKGPDFLACDGHDPEGNVFQVRENL